MKNFILSTILAIGSIFLFSQNSVANNVTISGVSVSGSDITFTLSWENSWNSTNNIDTLYPNNWDAVWVFVKRQSDSTNIWSHQPLSVTTSDHSATYTDPLTVETTTDSVGVFIKRTNPGSGNISSATVTLKMVNLPATGTYNFKVFGIEMIQIPKGPFYVGDGLTTTAPDPRFTSQLVDSTRQATGFSGGALFTGSPALSSAFPMGFDAMYAMKYEVTNEQYVEFLNCLTYDQQSTLMDAPPNSPASTNIFNNFSYSYVQKYIKIQTPGINNTQPAVIGCDYNEDGLFNDLPDGLTVACGGFNYASLLAFLDWSGLRPMSELEFEKLCRGSRNTGNPVAQVAYEKAWGTTDINNYHYLSNNLENINEPTMKVADTAMVLNGRGFFHNSYHPSRSGMFANNATGRTASGAGFYGNMELSGNLAEIIVSTVSAGATFTRKPGDGIIAVDGNTNESGWPSYSVNAFGIRGGYFQGNPSAPLAYYFGRITQTSNRYYANIGGSARQAYYGGRGVR